MTQYNKKVKLNKAFKELTNLIDKWEGYAWTLIQDERYIELTNEIDFLLKTL